MISNSDHIGKLYHHRFPIFLKVLKIYDSVILTLLLCFLILINLIFSIEFEILSNSFFKDFSIINFNVNITKKDQLLIDPRLWKKK